MVVLVVSSTEHQKLQTAGRPKTAFTILKFIPIPRQFIGFSRPIHFGFNSVKTKIVAES